MTITVIEPVALQTLVDELAASPDFWKPHIAYQSPRRYWAKLITRPDVDVWLLTWLQEQGTQFHDHGASHAAFTVVAGSLVETRPSPTGELLPRTLRTGQTATVAPYAIHDVHNPRVTPAISLHAYSPPLRTMTFYEPSFGGLIPTHRETITQDSRP